MLGAVGGIDPSKAGVPNANPKKRLRMAPYFMVLSFQSVKLFILLTMFAKERKEFHPTNLAVASLYGK